MKIDFIYVINLATDSQKVYQNIQKLNFKDDVPFYEFPAINGWDLVENKIDSPYKFKEADWWKLPSNPKEPQNDWWSRNLTPGEIGCGLSHYQVIEGAYNSGYENVLILEEDFYLNDEFDKFPEFELNHLNDDYSICYLGRSALERDKEESVNEALVRCKYTFNTHAYMISRKGMKEILESGYLDNMIPWDEFFSAINCATPRQDAVKNLGNPDFKAYAFKIDYINQSSHYDTDSLTEFTPEYVKQVKQDREIKVKKHEPIVVEAQGDIHNRKWDIQDDSNWEEWSKKYINPAILSQEYDLVIDEPCTHVYTFPFFTKAFCDELIALSEEFEWTTDRHNFYPTTDNLLEVLGMKDIYNRLINDYVRPLAINRFKLDGSSWDHLTDESFIIKYPHDQQAHLGIHHDHSSITTLVNLNPGEFEGGGTYFPKYKCLVNPKEIGVMTLHPGNITHKHGARAVTSGTRYVVVSFIKNSDHK